MPVPTMSLKRIDTPTGRMLIVTDEQGCLRALDWEDHEGRMLKLLRRYYREDAPALVEDANPSAASHALDAYFAGEKGALTELNAITNGTDFQRMVWQELRRIPFGRTISYSGLAAKIGRPAAIRAVGMANGANPIAIVIPCHRVIGADSSLTGYGGGLDRKRWLLEHEGVAASWTQPQLGTAL